MKRGLVAGTVVSLIVVGFWSVAAAIGPVPPLHLSWRHSVASYLALATAPTGNAAELVAVIYAVCLFTAVMRRARTRRGR